MKFPTRVWLYRDISHYPRVSTTEPLGLRVPAQEYVLRRDERQRSDRIVELEETVKTLRVALNSAAFTMESEAPQIGRYDRAMKHDLECKARQIREILSEVDES